MKTIAVANPKGGVGKSTTAATVATELAIREYETLLIDADPQGNATQIFFSPDQVSSTLTDVLPVAATINLAKFERERPLALTNLRSALKNVSDRQDPRRGQRDKDETVCGTSGTIPAWQHIST
jgi:cellulose biosynthesis protein BcsQ